MKRVTPDTQTWLAARDYLFARGDDFFLQMTRARETFEAEAIHDLRVSSRRLREGISLFAHCFRKRQFTPLGKELKGLTDMLGAIRNTDEALLFFSPLVAQCNNDAAAAVMNIIANLQASRIEEQQKLKRELKKIDPATVLGRMDDICSNPRIFNPNAKGLFLPIAEYLLDSVSLREKAIVEIVPEALVEDNIAAQHRLRIAVKRFRYRMEFLAPLSSDDYKGVYGVVKEYQEVLGHMHDLDVFCGLSGDMATGRAGELLRNIIHARRRLLFERFMQLHRTNALTCLGNRVRDLL